MGAASGVTLEEILDDNKLSKLFLDFVIKAHAHDNLEFWVEVEIYRRTKDSVILQKMGRRLYHTYLETGADLEVNLEKKYKEAVKQKIDLEFWDTALFDRAQRRIHHILSSDCVLVFAEKYLSDGATPSSPTPTKKENSKARMTLVKHLAQYREFRRLERAEDDHAAELRKGVLFLADCILKASQNVHICED